MSETIYRITFEPNDGDSGVLDDESTVEEESAADPQAAAEIARDLANHPSGARGTVTIRVQQEGEPIRVIEVARKDSLPDIVRRLAK